MLSSPPPILVAALALLATRALAILASYAAYLRWRARRTLRALLCAAGLGRAEDDAMAPDPADDEPEVEDVESVAAGLLPPAEHVHDYQRVEGLMRAWSRLDDDEEEQEADRRRSAPASPRSDSDELDGTDESEPFKPFGDRRAKKRLSLPPAGYANSGNTCFAASALQCLYHTRALTAHFADPGANEASRCCPARGGGGGGGGFCATCEYRDLVRRSLLARPKARVAIGPLTSSIGKIAKHFKRGRQEDSHEYIRSLLDAMHVGWLEARFGAEAEKAIDQRTQETTLVYHIFGGYTCGRVVCCACGHESRTYQSALDFPIEVAAGPRQTVSSVAAALRRNFVDTETLDGANKYKCGGCRAYVKAERGSKVHVSPNVLVVPVKRYQLGRAGKITKFVEYPAVLDLSPYMSDDAPYEGADSAPEYDLFGVVVHLDFMGSAHSGHYVAFVRLADGSWCKCDDGTVEATTQATALKQKAYLLFYERRAPRAAAPRRTPAQEKRAETLRAAARERARRAARRAKEREERKPFPARPARPAAGIDSSRLNATNELAVGSVVEPEHDVKTSGAARRAAEDSDSEEEGEEEDAEDASETDSTDDEGDRDVPEHLTRGHRSTLRERPWPAKVTVTVKLPGVTGAKSLRVAMTDATVSVATTTPVAPAGAGGAARRYALDVALPFPVDDDDAGVVFDSRARSLAIVAPVRPYTAARARAHGAFLARAARARRASRAKRARPAARAVAAAASSDSERGETGARRSDSDSDSGEARAGSDGAAASDGAGSDRLASDLGMMGLAASPTARRARVA